jgi:hypothetical protein
MATRAEPGTPRMRPPLVALISPYHLSTREVPALAALLLADRVLTLVPAPAGPDRRRRAQSAATRSKPYRLLFESWRWTEPLWGAGVLSAAIPGADPWPDVARAARRLESEPAHRPLRSFLRHGVFDDEASLIEALSRDILRAGPDPGLSIPVAAGMDALGARLALPVFRPEPASLVQRAEMRLARTLADLAIPLLVQADGAHLLDARARLDEPLDELRDLLSRLASGVRGREPVEAREPCARACARFAQAFARERAEIERSGDPDEPRALSGAARLRVASLPPDAVFRASLAAAAGTSIAAASRPVAARALAPAPGPHVTTIFVRRIGAPA